MTRENIGAPWLNFEAGALSKSVDQSRVSPFLLNLKRSEIQGPLLQFQSTIGESEDVRKLVQSLNRAGDAPLDEARLDSVFDVWWPHLDEQLRALASERPAGDKPKEEPSSLPAQTDILEELLELVRQQQKLLNSPEALLPPSYLSRALRMSGRERFDRAPAAYRDLRVRYDALNDLIDQISEQEIEAAPALRELVRQLGRPVHYFARPEGYNPRLRPRDPGDQPSLPDV